MYYRYLFIFIFGIMTYCASYAMEMDNFLSFIEDDAEENLQAPAESPALPILKSLSSESLPQIPNEVFQSFVHYKEREARDPKSLLIDERVALEELKKQIQGLKEIVETKTPIMEPMNKWTENILMNYGTFNKGFVDNHIGPFLVEFLDLICTNAPEKELMNKIEEMKKELRNRDERLQEQEIQFFQKKRQLIQTTADIEREDQTFKKPQPIRKAQGPLTLVEWAHAVLQENTAKKEQVEIKILQEDPIDQPWFTRKCKVPVSDEELEARVRHLREVLRQ